MAKGRAQVPRREKAMSNREFEEKMKDIREEYNAEESLRENYETFEAYLEYLLDLGRQKCGGIVEAD